MIADASHIPPARGGSYPVRSGNRVRPTSERGLDVRVIFWRSPEQEAHEAGVHFSGTEEERAWLAERGARGLVFAVDPTSSGASPATQDPARSREAE